MSVCEQINWRGQVFGPRPFVINALSGWLSLPGGNYQAVQGNRHGFEQSPVWQSERIVKVSGTVRSTAANRDALVRQLKAATIPRPSDDSTPEELTVTAAGVATAAAQLIELDIDIDALWRGGQVPWAMKWRCPDPRVFGSTVSTAVPLVIVTDGVNLPQMMPFLMPAKPLGGRVVVTNPGNDPEGSPAVYTLVGPQTGTVGVRNVTTGHVVTYSFSLAGPDVVNNVPADVLVIDTERGGAFLNGEYRPPTPESSVTAEMRMAPGTNVIQALGTAGSGSPSITAAVRPASW